MMDRRRILKAAAGFPVLLLSENRVYGANMTGEIKTFAIKGFNSTFSTVVDKNLITRKLQEYDNTYTPIIRLSEEDFATDDFSIEIACFEAKAYADALSMGLAITGVWGGRNIDFDKENLSFVRAIVTYRENEKNNQHTRLHVFKNATDFVILCFTYGESKEKNDIYKTYEEEFINNFRFEKKRDSASQISVIQLDSRSTILLPRDWKYRDVSNGVRQDFDPKNTLTRAYSFAHKERPNNSLPNIALVHYRDDIEDARYLLDHYKEKIVEAHNNPPTTIFDDAEILTSRDDKGEITLQSLIIRLRDSDNQSLPMVIRVTLLQSETADGCYLIHTTGATVTDGRIRQVGDFNTVNAWMIIDVIGSSMERLFVHTLSQGLSDYPRIFD